MYHWDRVLAPNAWAALYQLEQHDVGDRDAVCLLGTRQLVEHHLAERAGRVTKITPLGRDAFREFHPTVVGRIGQGART